LKERAAGSIFICIDHDVGGLFILSTDFGSLDVDRRPMVVVVVAAAIECVTCDVYFIIVIMFMVNDVFEIIK
jgi:hypothetical protein